MDPFASRRELFYRHSWKAPIGGLLLVGAAGLISTLLLGLVYGYAMFYIPFIYIKLIFLMGYPMAIGFIVAMALHAGKIRNDLVAILAGVGFGLLADYTGWVAWIAAVLKDSEFLMIFFYPFDVFYLVQRLSEVFTYEFSSMQINGATNYLIWLIEAAIVIGGTAYLTIKYHFDDPFCEECNEWVGTERYIGLFSPLADEAKFKQDIKQGNFQSFLQLKASNIGNRFTKVTMRECQTCRNFRVLNVKSLWLTVNSKKEIESKDTNVFVNLRVTPELLPFIERLAQSQNQLQ